MKPNFSPGYDDKHGCALKGAQNPADAGVQFRLCAILQYSKTPSLRWPGIEDEDDDENEAPHALRTETEPILVQIRSR
jgi:hypothetical protein